MTGQRPPHPFDDSSLPQDAPRSARTRREPHIDAHESADPYAPHAPRELDNLPEADAPYPTDFQPGYQHPQHSSAAQPYADDDYDDYPEPRRRTPGLAMLGAVFGLVLIAGAGVAGYRYLASDTLVASGEPPLIKADASPIKIVPETSTTPTEDSAQNKLIYGRIEGGNPANANVVASSEEPVERPPAAPRDVSRVILPGGPQQRTQDAHDQSEEEMRRIRTVVIKPETVPGAAGIAPNSPESVAPVLDETIKKPASEGASQGMALLGDNAVGIMVGGEEEDDAPAAPEGQQTQPMVPVDPVAVPLPQSRPSSNPSAAAQQPAQAPAQQQTAVLSPPQNQSPDRAPAASSGGAGFYVQLASHRSDAEARSTYAAMQRRYAQVLGQYQPVIQPANLGERGTYHRLRVGPFASRNDAITVCNALKDAGGTCIVQQ